MKIMKFLDEAFILKTTCHAVAHEGDELIGSTFVVKISQDAMLLHMKEKKNGYPQATTYMLLQGWETGTCTVTAS